MESGGHVSSTGHPVWAPDGKTLAAGFSMSDGKPATIVIIPAAGGPGRTLLTGPTDFDWAP